MHLDLNIGFLASAAASLLFMLLHLAFSSRGRDAATARIFKVVLLLGFLEVAAEVVALIAFADPAAVALPLLYLVVTFLALMRCLLPFALALYALYLCADYMRLAAPVVAALCLPFAFALFATVANPWFHLLFSFEGQSHLLQMGSIGLFEGGYTAFYCLLSVACALRYRLVLRRRTLVAVLEFAVLILGSCLGEWLVPQLMLTGLAIALGGLVLLLSAGSPFSATDPLTGAYDAALFRSDAERILKADRPFEVVFARLQFPQQLAGLIGSSLTEEGLVLCANAFFRASGGRRVYRLAPSLFACIVLSRRERLRTTEQLEQFFAASHQLSGATVSLGGAVGFVAPQGPLASADELQNLVEFAAEALETWGRGEQLAPAPSPEEVETAFRRQNLVRRCLGEALEHDYFAVYLQPLWSVAEGKFASAEALSRLIHPEEGFISPAEFIPLAEEAGSIGEIGRLQFRRICAFAAAHRSRLEELGIRSIKVNVSAVEIMDPDYPAFVAATMAEAGIGADFFEFEITETAATSLDERMDSFLRAVAAGGSKLCMDDFGSGFANLSMICSLPFDVVKLDSSLLRGVVSDHRVAALYRDVLSTMANLGMETVCEGVETAEEVQLVTQWRADLIQGFYFARPMPFEDVLEGSWRERR